MQAKPELKLDSPAAKRKSREAAALRANLAKRKSQQRARSEQEKETPNDES